MNVNSDHPIWVLYLRNGVKRKTLNINTLAKEAIFVQLRMEK